MQANNKINTPRQDIDVESAQFYQFMQALKEHRSFIKNRLEQSQPKVAQLSHFPLSEQESSPFLKDLYSERSRSLHMQNNRKSEHFSHIFREDEALKNKFRLGVANRYRLKQQQIPPQYFNPTKVKLQQFLKESRILSNAEISSNEKIVSPKKKQLLNQNQLSYANGSKIMQIDKSMTSFQELNAEVAMQYCLNHQLQENSGVKQIRLFFAKLLEITNLSLSEPQIQKHKDGIYFGPGLKKRRIGRGFLYKYSRSLYIGEFLQGQMHGKGVQIFFKFPAIYKGDFEQGIMHGYFQVSKDGQKYKGAIQNGLYHGYGKLQTQAGIFQGQFRNGKLGNASKSMIRQLLNKTNSGFRIRDNSHQHSSNPNSFENQYVQNNMSFHNNNKPQQSQVYPWSYNEKHSQVRKAKPNYLSDMIQFSYPFGGEIPQQRASQRKRHRASFVNPENNVVSNRISAPKQKQSKQMEYFARYQRPIIQRTDFAQQQPLQLKC